VQKFEARAQTSLLVLNTSGSGPSASETQGRLARLGLNCETPTRPIEDQAQHDRHAGVGEDKTDTAIRDSGKSQSIAVLIACVRVGARAD
jgi:hypothetical protein